MRQVSMDHRVKPGGDESGTIMPTLVAGIQRCSPDEAQRNPGTALPETPDYASLHPGYACLIRQSMRQVSMDHRVKPGGDESGTVMPALVAGIHVLLSRDVARMKRSEIRERSCRKPRITLRSIRATLAVRHCRT